LLDRRLAEFCLALPPEQKLRDGWTRYVMRRAVDDVLPPAVRERAWKHDPSRALFSKLVSRDAERAIDSIRRNEELLVPYVDIAGVLEQDRRYRSNRDAHGAAQVYWVASLGNWLRRSGLRA
jgi:asparagine synthase (glutamine-hydrolysing)